jgi:hypothetical protein
MDTYRWSSLDTRFPLSPDDDTDDETLELREEVARLRAALVEERARRDYCEMPAEPGWDIGPEKQRAMWRASARADLIAEGLLPPD